jgi:hypothetical protein
VGCGCGGLDLSWCGHSGAVRALEGFLLPCLPAWLRWLFATHPHHADHRVFAVQPELRLLTQKPFVFAFQLFTFHLACRCFRLRLCHSVRSSSTRSTTHRNNSTSHPAPASCQLPCHQPLHSFTPLACTLGLQQSNRQSIEIITSLVHATVVHSTQIFRDKQHNPRAFLA